MPMPNERTMHSLHSLAYGKSGGAYDNGAIVIKHSECSWLVHGQEIDELESLGWITIQSGDDVNVSHVNITDKGLYWLNKWIKQESKKCVSR